MQAYLEDSDGQKYLIPADDMFVIGHGRSCHLSIKVQDIAAVHAHIEVQRDDLGTKYVLTDTSHNGSTYVNEQQIDSKVLSHGDKLTFGNFKKVFTFSKKSRTARIAPNRMQTQKIRTEELQSIMESSKKRGLPKTKTKVRSQKLEEGTNLSYYLSQKPDFVYVLEKDKEFTIGREPKNDLPLFFQKVSRLHAKIRWEKGAFVIYDWHSSNGTIVNEERVKSHVLKNGDKIYIGNQALEFHERVGEVPQQEIKKAHIQKSEFGAIKAHQLIKELGKGEWSTVYLAKNVDYNEYRVIKFFTNLSKDGKFLKRFFQELRISMRLKHPDIVKVIGFDQTSENVWFLVMEYMDGEDLGKFIEKNGKIPPKQALHIAIKVAKALQYAHSNNMVHRDLKPANIVLKEDPFLVKLIDFGIAKVLGEGNLTRQGEVFGTVNYMSPEQLEESKDVDERTDIYSLGATLYHMLSGKYPYWDKEDYTQAYKAALSDFPASLTDVASDLPWDVVDIVDKAMARNPISRYQNMDEIIADLQKVFVLL